MDKFYLDAIILVIEGFFVVYLISFKSMIFEILNKKENSFFNNLSLETF